MFSKVNIFRQKINRKKAKIKVSQANYIKESMKKPTNEALFFIGLFTVVARARFCGRTTKEAPHNHNYVVFLFIYIARAQAFVFACDAPLRFPSYRSLWYSHCCDREYPQGAQYPFASYNTCAQKDDEDCAETPFLLKLLL